MTTEAMNSERDSRSKCPNILQNCDDCGEQFDTKNRRAKYLPCLHTFCERCLVKETKGKDLFTCSECTMQVYVPSNGVKGFQENYFIMNQLEKYKKDQGVKKRRKLSCRRCNRNAPAEAWCVECGTFICMRCIRAHNEHPLVTHEVCHLSRLNSSMRRKVAQSRERCVNHIKEAVEYFCQTPGCNKPICRKCLHNEHSEHNHDVTSLTDLVTRYKEELQRLLQAVKVKEDTLQKQSENIQLEMKELENSMNDTEKQVRDYFDECRQTINQQEQNSLSQLNKLRSDWSTLMGKQSADVTKTLSRMCAGSTFTANSMEYGSDVQIARSQPLMKARLEELSSTNVTIGPQTMGTLRFNKPVIIDVVDDVIQSGIIVASCVHPPKTVVSIPSALVHTDCVVTIEPRDKFGNKYNGLTKDDISTTLSCELFSNEAIGHKLRSGANGSFEVLYNPSYIGEHKLGVTIFGHELQKKFSIRVHPFILHPQVGYKGELSYIIIETPNCTCAGTPHTIEIDDITTVKIKAPSGQHLSFKLRDNHDSTYSATFRPTEHGEHIADVSVKCKATFIAERKVAKINVVNRHVESLLPPSKYAVRRSPILSSRTNGPRVNLKTGPKINHRPKNDLMRDSSPFNSPKSSPSGSPVLPRVPNQRISIVAFEEDIS
ncbi:E3 ubiquitin-protein ligase TRIM45-like [Antedon mediterranea]|uniref:E3 ubiquitin-protein ligase TRIM45-like n=1 Tax=Antedon mediterranea TaxID=105859 RepID=UPI003AF49576